MSKITSQDIDRLLGLGDQFLEDWEVSYGACLEGDDYPERKAEWDAARPLMVAAPEMFAILKDVVADYEGRFGEVPTDCDAYWNAVNLLQRFYPGMTTETEGA